AAARPAPHRAARFPARPAPAMGGDPGADRGQNWPKFSSLIWILSWAVQAGNVVPMTATDSLTQIPVRLDFDAHADGFARAMAHLDRAATTELDKVDFDPKLRELVRIRASQLNGCACCIH